MEEKLTKDVWRRFVEEGSLDAVRIDNRIKESWYQCRRNGVNPFNGKGTQILSLEQLNDRKQRSEALLEVAQPFLHHLHKLFKHSKSILLFIDRDGYVLKVVGDEDTLNDSKEINFIEGVKWTEDLVGTNAIGTTLRNREPISVLGTEHYAVASQSWSCSAAPIMDEDGSLLGVLDVSSKYGSCDHHFTLGTVVATAFAIEYEWQKRLKEEEEELLQLCSGRSDGLPFVLCNRRLKVLETQLNSDCRILVGKRMDEIALSEVGLIVKVKLPVFSKKSKRLIGYQFFVEEQRNSPSVYTTTGSNQTKKEIFQFNGVTGVSGSFAHVLQQASQVARTNVSVHLTGETGTGKGVLAKSIHLNSDRSQGPFVEVNCGAIPKELLESELFGYAPGAFTGARKNGYKGKLVQANGGTLFLDEIGEMPHAMQVALLKVIQDKRVTPIGSNDEIPIDIRIISATNQDLPALMKAGVIRKDFYYRLFVFPIQLPPLRARKEDIPSFISWYCGQHQWNVSWTKDLINEWLNHRWPGNIRELFNTLDRLRVIYPDSLPPPSQLRMAVFQWADGDTTFEEQNSVERSLSFREKLERDTIKQVLEKTDGKVTRAIAELGMPRSTFYRKLKKYGL